MLHQGLNRAIISPNNTHRREALLIILDSKVPSSPLLQALLHGLSHMKTMPTFKKSELKYARFISAPRQRRFPVNDCQLGYLVSLHENLMLINDSVLSRWFIYGRGTMPVAGTAQWLDGLTHLHHLASEPSISVSLLARGNSACVQ